MQVSSWPSGCVSDRVILIVPPGRVVTIENVKWRCATADPHGMDLLRDLARRPIEAALAAVLVIALGLLLWPLVPGAGESGGPSEAGPAPITAPTNLDASIKSLSSQPYTFHGTVKESLVCECGGAFTRDQTVQGSVAAPAKAMWTVTEPQGTTTAVVNGSTMTQRGPNGDVTDIVQTSSPLNPSSPLRLPAESQIAKVGPWTPADVNGVSAVKATLTIQPSFLTFMLLDRWNSALRTEASGLRVQRGEVTVWLATAAPQQVLREQVDVVIQVLKSSNGRGTYQRALDLTFDGHGAPVTVPENAFGGTPAAPAVPVEEQGSGPYRAG